MLVTPYWRCTTDPISQLRNQVSERVEAFVSPYEEMGASFGLEARSQNEGNTRLPGKGRVQNLAVEARVSVCVNLSSVWVTVSPGHVYCCPQASVAMVMREVAASGAQHTEAPTVPTDP